LRQIKAVGDVATNLRGMNTQTYAEREAQLRPLLEEIDERLLAILAARKRVGSKLLRKIARHEAARTAILRLIECPTPSA
jgi:hypothetical protein